MRQFIKNDNKIDELGGGVPLMFNNVQSSGIMGPPDYAKKETTNRISTNGGTWTVDRDGYVLCFIQLTGAGTGIIAINDQEVYHDANAQGVTGGFPIQVVVPVSKNDVVKLRTNMAFGSCSCYYIPPVKTYAPVAVIDKQLVASGGLIQSGETQFSDTAANTTSAVVHVTFPVAFDTEPQVFTEWKGGTNQWGYCNVAITSISTTGFDIYMHNAYTTASGAVPFRWTAVAGATVQLAAAVATPDYTRVESTNRITENNGTWTVDRDGYVMCCVWGDRDTTGQVRFQFSVNNTTVFEDVHYIDPAQAVLARRTLQVKKGDVVRIRFDKNPDLTGIGIGDIFCHYIPPKIQFTDTTTTADTSYDPIVGVERQVLKGNGTPQLALNGKPIYEQSFYIASYPIPADYATASVTLIPSGIATVEHYLGV